MNNIDEFKQQCKFLEDIHDGEIETLKDNLAKKLKGMKGQEKRWQLGIAEGGTVEGCVEELERLAREKTEERENHLKGGRWGGQWQRKMKDDVDCGKYETFYLKKMD